MESHSPSLQAIAPAPPVGPPSPGPAARAANGAAEKTGFADTLAGCQAPAATGAAAQGSATETDGANEESTQEEHSRCLPLRGKTSPESGAELPPGMAWMWPTVPVSALPAASGVASAGLSGSTSDAIFGGMVGATSDSVSGAPPTMPTWVGVTGFSSSAFAGMTANRSGFSNGTPSPTIAVSGEDSVAADVVLASPQTAVEGLPNAAATTATWATALARTAEEVGSSLTSLDDANPGPALLQTIASSLGSAAAAGDMQSREPAGVAAVPWSAALPRGTGGAVSGNNAGITSAVAAGAGSVIAADAAFNATADGDAGGSGEATADGAGQHGATARADAPDSASGLWNAGQLAATKGSSFAATLGSVAVPVGSPQFADSLADEVQVVVNPALGNGLRSATLKLNPEHLGPVEVRVLVHEQQASVAFTAQHTVAREALEAALPRLRESLLQQGFVQVNLDVGSQGTNLAQQGFRQGAAPQSDSQRGFAAFGAPSSPIDSPEAMRPRRAGMRAQASGGFDGYA